MKDCSEHEQQQEDNKPVSHGNFEISVIEDGTITITQPEPMGTLLIALPGEHKALWQYDP